MRQFKGITVNINIIMAPESRLFMFCRREKCYSARIGAICSAVYHQHDIYSFNNCNIFNDIVLP